MQKYVSDGRGRDSFITFGNDRNPPARSRVPLKAGKVASAKPPTLPRFQASGSGRDMFCQVEKEKIFPHRGVIGGKVSVERKTASTGVTRRFDPPTYHPSGSGRDLFFVGGFDAWHAPHSNTFKVQKNDKIVKARTSPPPRFISSGMK